MSYSTISQVADNVYVNVVFDHDDNNGNQPSSAEYKVTKTIPILRKCSDYYCSVIRFTIPLNFIPLFIMPIVPNQGDADLSPLIIGITYLGINYPVNVIYNPDNTLSPPSQLGHLTQVITPYYYVYSIQNLLNNINIALAAAITASGLKAILDAIPAKCPWFTFDPVSKLISLIVPTIFTNPTVGPELSIFTNAQLSEYLQGFQKLQIGFNQPQGNDFIFVLNAVSFPPSIAPSYNPYPQSDKAFYPIPAGGPDPSGTYTYYKFTQEYVTSQFISSLRKILIVTNSIPIISEYVPSNDNNSGVSTILPIISDFVPQLELPGQSRSLAYYVPTTQYRLADMVSNEQLNTIDLKIYWQDTDLNIYPLFLSVYQQASVKIGFFKKELYKSSTPLLKK